LQAWLILRGYWSFIKAKTTVKKAAFNKKGTLCTSKFDLHLRKKPVKCYIWIAAFCGGGTWTLRKVIRNAWKVLKYDGGERWRRSAGPIV
jgi:hypothetical protein